MGDFIDFDHKVKKITKRCGSDEREVYTEIYKFNYPHSHRVQGGLRIGNGQITAALILCSDSEDKHLLWPVKLEVKVLGYKDGNTKLLGTREIPWTIKWLEEGPEDISWKNGITISIKELQEKDIIGTDDSVTFLWSVKLSYPQPQDLQSCDRSSDAALQETFSDKMESEAEEGVGEYQEHKLFQKDDITHCSLKDSNNVSKKSDDRELDNDAEDSAQVEKIAAEMISYYGIDTVPHIMNLEIAMGKKEISNFKQKQTGASNMTKDVQEAYEKATAAGERNILGSKHTHCSSVNSDSALSTLEDIEPNVSTPAWKTLDADLVEMLLEVGRKQNAEKQRKLTSLMRLCLHGDKGRVRKLMKEAFTDIDIQGPWGMTALMFASWNGNKGIVQLLLKKNVDVNTTNSMGMNALMIATMNGHTKIVNRLARKGADVHKTANLKLFWTELTLLLKTENSEDLTKLMSCRLTCFIIAAASGQCNIVSRLLKHGVDINAETDNGMSALKAASYTGHYETVRLLLEFGGRINFREKSLTPVMMGSVMENVNIIQMLLDKGADVNVSTADGTTALMVAAFSGSGKVVKALVHKKAEVNAKDKRGCTSLMFASAGGHLDVAEFLLMSGANVNICRGDGVDVLMIASAHGHTGIVELLLNRRMVLFKDKNDRNALIYATVNGHSLIVQRLLQKSYTNVNSKDRDGNSALSLASMNNDIAIVKMLLKSEAINIDLPNRNGMTPLMYASLHGNSDIIKLLLQEGADINAYDNKGMTSLVLACENGHSVAVQILLSSGAKFKQNALSGRISSPDALVRASSNGHTNIVEILLRCGALVNAVDKNGMTPLTAASRYGHPKTVMLLTQGKEKSKIEDHDTLKAIGMAYQNGHSEVLQILLNGLQAGDSETSVPERALNDMYVSSSMEPSMSVLRLTSLDMNLQVANNRTQKVTTRHFTDPFTKYDCPKYITAVSTIDV